MPNGTPGAYGCGTQTAAVSIGGYGGVAGQAFLYNGSTWSSLATTSTNYRRHAACGNSTAALAFGGIDGNVTEEFNAPAPATQNITTS